MDGEGNDWLLIGVFLRPYLAIIEVLHGGEDLQQNGGSLRGHPELIPVLRNYRIKCLVESQGANFPASLTGVKVAIFS